MTTGSSWKTSAQTASQRRGSHRDSSTANIPAAPIAPMPHLARHGASCPHVHGGKQSRAAGSGMVSAGENFPIRSSHPGLTQCGGAPAIPEEIRVLGWGTSAAPLLQSPTWQGSVGSWRRRRFFFLPPSLPAPLAPAFVGCRAQLLIHASPSAPRSCCQRWVGSASVTPEPREGDGV